MAAAPSDQIAADIGLIGLGVMGANLALNLADHGLTVAVHDRDGARLASLAGTPGLLPCQSLAQLVDGLTRPARIILLVPAGRPVDDALAGLMPSLQPRDIVVDAGNSHYKDTIRRTQDLFARYVEFAGIGISGGAEGARRGPAIMAGGSFDIWEQLAPVMTSIAARRPDGGACAVWCGGDGAGHFVKMVHNGIEYAVMQLIAEAAAGLAPDRAAALFRKWTQGPLDSYLLEISAEIMAMTDPDSGRPVIEVIEDQAAEKGTGRWAAAAALELGVPAPTLIEAVQARALSALKAERAMAARRLAAETQPAADPDPDDLGRALLGGTLAAFAQGFRLIGAAAGHYGWRVDTAGIAEAWQGGCIIRARLLHHIAEGARAGLPPDEVMLLPWFQETMTSCLPAMRRVVAHRAAAGLAAPALASALAWYDGWRTARGTGALIQGMRDYFGGHGFRRTDRPGEHHLP